MYRVRAICNLPLTVIRHLSSDIAHSSREPEAAVEQSLGVRRPLAFSRARVLRRVRQPRRGYGRGRPSGYLGRPSSGIGSHGAA
jgi:hypothetical protein